MSRLLIPACAGCHASAGIAITRSARILGFQKGNIYRYRQSRGLRIDSGRRPSKQALKDGLERRNATNWQSRANTMVMDEYTQDAKAINKAEKDWLRHPVRLQQMKEMRGSYYVYDAEYSRAKAKAYWERKRNDASWMSKRKSNVNKYRSNNRAFYNDSAKQWRITNIDKWRECARKSRSRPQAKIGNNLRKRVRNCIGKGLRIEATAKLIGCNRQFLMQWLQDKFAKGMSWNNYGEWHIDHILPCASFDLTKPDQQHLCFHYTNLQPLWAQDNLDKSDIMPTQHQPELAMALT